MIKNRNKEDYNHEESCECGHLHSGREGHMNKMIQQNDKKMKISLKGLNCSNCAAKIEADTSKISGVSNSNINLMKQELVMDVSESSNKKNIYENVERIVHIYEPDVIVNNGDEKQEEDVEDYKKELNKKIISFAMGIILFLIAQFGNLNELTTTVVFLVSYLIFGLEVLKTAVKNIGKGQIFDENFLMSISTIGAIVIGEMPEAVFVMLFYQIGETFQDLAVNRSRKSIKDLMNIRPDFANLEINSGVTSVEPEQVSIGDIIIVKPGEKIPLDGVIIQGEAQIDTSALTGESVPRTVRPNDEVLSGSINTNGVLRVRVTKSFGESTAVKILELVENATSKKSKTEQFITKFAKVYTPIVVFLAVALAIIPPMITAEPDIKMWIGRALIFLVISCPCALVLSVPLGFFSGIGESSKKGILVKGSNYMQVLSEVDTVVFDKTGTLTKGVFEVSEIVNTEGFTKQELLKITALGEKMSNHPIAKSIIAYYENEYGVGDDVVSKYEEIGGHGISCEWEGIKILAGNKKLMKKENIQYEEYTGIGSVVYTAIDGKYAGYIVVSDKIKEDSKKAISKLKDLGVKNIVMLTGDSKITAEKMSSEIGIDQCYSELLPQNKVEKLEQLLQKKGDGKGKIAFVGDGINDAPVLARADVGIAMGGIGSDAAIEAADVVIMNDEPSKIADGIQIARSTNKIVTQNIVFALGVKIIVLALGAIGFASMWMAVFADVGVTFIAIINSMRKKI